MTITDYKDIVRRILCSPMVFGLCSDLYRVVAEPDKRSKKVDYKVIRIDDQSSQPEGE